MKLSIAQFAKLDSPTAVIIHSLDVALYHVTVVINGKEYRLVENSGRTFRRRSLQAVREALQPLPINSVTLRHLSAYDEMIGQPDRAGSNALEVRLSLDSYPAPLGTGT